ncbi:MAG: family N-acetyltransferase [Chitinophagaceae bacterium]|nr:family N-acetyltransferase [Chitinophagaceae bacterium]
MRTTIRKATLQDLEPLSLLFDGYRVFYEKESNLAEAKIFLRDRINNKESEIFVAVDATGTMTGFTQLFPIFSSTRMKRFWLLNDLFVHPLYRGQGISKALLFEVQQFSRETDSCGLMLETAKTNAIGNSLYPAVGFILDAEHNYYTWDAK